MSVTRHQFTRSFPIATAVLVGTCVLSTVAAGQTTSTQLSTDCTAYASVPLPAEAENGPIPKTPPGCASYRSYRGIGRPVNYSEARACAFRERLAQKANLGQNSKEPFAWVVGGSLILADIYFNGAGVQRNVPLAMRFACEFEEGTAKLAVADINKSNGSAHTHGPFEFCDYAASTFTMNFCNGYDSEVEDDRKARFYNSLKRSMPGEQQTAFDNLLAAKSAYIKAHANEVYQGGSIRVIRTLSSEEILKDNFNAQLVHFEKKKWPTLSESRINGADALLHEAYQKAVERLRAQTKDDFDDGGVTGENLSRVEEAWEHYRDAWVAFASLRYPTAVPAIRAEITLDRYRLLKTIR